MTTILECQIIDIKKIECDFLVFSSHKMLGPMGIGVLYGKKELLDKMYSFMTGGGMIKKVDFNESEFASIPEKFEAGTQNISGTIGLKEAINYIEKIGIGNINNWEKELLDYGLKKIKEIRDIEIYNSHSNTSAIISFNIKGVHPHDVASILDESGIAIRAGHHCAMPLMKVLGIGGTARVSLAFYNTFEDIDKLVECLNKIKEKFENGKS